MALPRVYLASPVFRQMAGHEQVSPDKRAKIAQLFKTLEKNSELFESKTRFPSSSEIKTISEQEKINIIGCHLSHTITEDVMPLPHLKAVCTATAGYNHIEGIPKLLEMRQSIQPETTQAEKERAYLRPPWITHTPSVLQKAVADFIIALILSNLKNIPNLNQYVFNGKWRSDQPWDMDAFLGRSLSSLTLGIIGMGEIGQAVVKKLTPWNMQILYNSRTRNPDLESKIPNLSYCDTPDEIFKKADIVSLNVPLTHATRHLANRRTLSMMKPGALLVNTARGEVVDMEALISLLEAGQIAIDLAFDVFDPEPIPMKMLHRFQQVTKQNRDQKFIFMPHTASADADTRAQMVIMMLHDIIAIARHLQDLDNLPKKRETPAQSMGHRIDTHDEERLSMKDLPDAMETMTPAFPDIHLIPELKV